MHKEWNPKFGFFLPCVTHLKNSSIHSVDKSSYDSMMGPFPMDEFCSRKDPLSVRLDRFVDFIYTKVNSNKKLFRNLDMIVLCDYSCTYHARNFFVTSHDNPEIKQIESSIISNTTIIKSSTDKYRRYVSPPLSSHYFTTQKTSIRK